MTSYQDISFNQTEDPALSSTDFPPLKASNAHQASQQPLKGVEKAPQLPSSGSRSTDFSSQNTPSQNTDQFGISPVSDDSEPFTASLPRRLTAQESVSVLKKRGRPAGKKEQTKAQKNAPQKRRNANFAKTSKPRKQRRSSGTKKTPQSPYKNVYKAIFCEILSYIQLFCSIASSQHNRISQEAKKSKEDWVDDTENSPTLIEGLGYELVESQDVFIGWLQDNKIELEGALEDKRFVKFLPLSHLIQESEGLINDKACRKYYEERKGKSLDGLKDEGMILTWLLIVTFSLVWLPQEVTFFPLQESTVALLHWVSNSKTQAKGKSTLLNEEDRRHIREFLEATFLTLFYSAWEQFPDRRSWLNEVAKLDPVLYKQVLVDSPAQLTTVSTADSEALFPSENQVQGSSCLEDLSQKVAAFVGQDNEIKTDQSFVGCKVIEESKFVLDFFENFLAPQKPTPMEVENFEDDYFPQDQQNQQYQQDCHMEVCDFPQDSGNLFEDDLSRNERNMFGEPDWLGQARRGWKW